MFSSVRHCYGKTSRFASKTYSKSFSRNFRVISATYRQNKYTASGPDRIVRCQTPVDIPDDQSLYEFLTSEFTEYGDKAALIDGVTDESLTFNDLSSLTKKFGSLLRKQGFADKDVVALYSPNCIEYPVPLVGTFGNGGIVSTASPLFTKHELANQLTDSASKFIVTRKMFLDTAKAAADIAGGINKIILLDENEATETDVLSWSDITNDDGTEYKIPRGINPQNDLAILPYSSGTTGKPKGVMLTHHNIIANTIQIRGAFEIENHKCLGLLPFFHIYGMVLGVFYNLRLGKTIVTLPKFDPLTFLTAMAKHKVDFANLVPPLFLFMAKHPVVQQFDLTSLKYTTCGAAPFGEDLYLAFKEKLPFVEHVLQGYGLTETSPVALLTPPDWVKPGSAGVPVPETEIRVIHIETGEVLGPNEQGEVQIRGPQVMKGYLNNDAATAGCMTDDGWFCSGDLGYYDDDHHFFIVDRMKELIKYKGYQVPPAELEDLLISHPNVADAAVIGVPDDVAGELARAFVVKNGDVNEDVLIEFVQERVAPYKRLSGGVIFIDEIPKAVSGKILRRVLKEKYILNDQ